MEKRFRIHLIEYSKFSGLPDFVQIEVFNEEDSQWEDNGGTFVSQGNAISLVILEKMNELLLQGYTLVPFTK